MSKNLDAVVVTDHNGGGWIDRLKVENDKLKAEDPKPAGYRTLTLFPGVEITVNDGFHVLVILDPSCGTDDITSILGGNINVGELGSHEAKSSENMHKLLERLSSQSSKVVVIPAHVDGKKGLLRDKLINSKRASLAVEAGETLLPIDARTLEHVLSHPMVYALESHRNTSFTYDPVPLGLPRRSFAIVYGSDSHERADIGIRSTWVRMSEPTLAGLKVALMDGASSARSHEAGKPDPGPHSPFIIKRIEIAKSKYMGRLQPLVLDLNPSFNAIIGGRGTGKSSIVELLRRATKRDVIIEREGGDLWSNLSGLLGEIATNETSVFVDYELHGKLFRLQSQNQGTYTLHQQDNNGVYAPLQDGGSWTERFPIRIFSQKQLYSLRQRTAPLLDEVDATTEVEGAQWKRDWDILLNEFIQLRLRKQALKAQLSGRADLEARQADKKRQLEVMEKAGHQAVLRELSLRKRQAGEMERWEAQHGGIATTIRDLAGRLAFEFPALRLSGGVTATSEPEVEKAASEFLHLLEAESKVLTASATRIEAARQKWTTQLAASAWKSAFIKAESDYQSLISELQGTNTKPEQYGQLVHDMQALQTQLKNLDAVAKEIENATNLQKNCYQKICEHRKELTRKRKAFLVKHFGSGQQLKAELEAFADAKAGIQQLRALLSRESVSDGEFNAMEKYLLDADSEMDREERLVKLKTHLASRTDEASAATGIQFGVHFLNHLASRTSEDISRLWTWFPPDLLDLKYRTSKAGDFKPLAKGSPGQVTAAVLAFLLAYGDEPMILDQPEDDLDNSLISDLVVTAIQTNKQRRQFIIVTHNPNIVVNGNADLVFPLHESAGQTSIPSSGSLQHDNVRKEVCEIMEGGREALERRFRQMIE